ncbi:MAG: hypothetical protein ACREIP_18170 [Alphaproteobacteria bacterium]
MRAEPVPAHCPAAPRPLTWWQLLSPLNQRMYWYERFLAIQGLLFNLLFACVAVGLHFWGLPIAAETLEFRTLRYMLGAAILIGLVLEPFALRVKFRETLRDIHGGILGDRDEDAGPRSLGLVLAWFIHLIVASLLLLLAMQALGLGPRTYPVLFIGAATVLVLREMYILGLIVVPPDRDRHTSGWRIFASDVVLLGLATAGYSAAWTVIVARVGRAAGDDIFATLTDAAITCFLFGLFLVAMRFGFLVEEGIARRNRAMAYAVWLSIVLALAAAMLPYYLHA